MALRDPQQLKLLQRAKRRSKYGAEKVVLDGIRFDSKAEAARWIQLKEMQRKKIIKGLELKPVYKFASGVKYIPDFMYIENQKWVTEDVKGVETREFKTKKKMMLHEYGIDVQVVRINASVADVLIKAYQNKHAKKTAL